MECVVGRGGGIGTPPRVYRSNYVIWKRLTEQNEETGTEPEKSIQ
jgi:hypothetical protein